MLNAGVACSAPKTGKKTAHIYRFRTGCASTVKPGFVFLGIDLINVDTKNSEVLPAVQYMEKNYTDNLTDNGYWMLVMHLYDKFGVDMHNGYLDTMHAVTPATVSGFGKRYLTDSSRLQLIMKPAE